MISEPVHDQPSEANAEDGAVIVDGPGGVAVAMTPDAAEKTGERLKGSASEARGQREPS